MAQIKGVELRGYTLLQGDVRDGFLAFIYFNGEKIGSVIDPPTNEEMKFKITDDSHKVILNQIAIEYYIQNPATIKGVIPFFTELSELTTLEEMFETECQNGANSLVLMRYSNRTDTVEEIFSAQRERLISLSEGVRMDELIKAYNPVQYTVYSELKDFIKQ